MDRTLIFGIALLVFGPKKLPELGKEIGEGIRGIKSAMKEHEAATLRGPSPIRTSAYGDHRFCAPERSASTG